ESALEFANLRRHQLRKAQQQRGGNTAARQVLNDFLEVGRSGISFGRAHDKVTFAIYVKVPSSPVFDPVGFDYLFDRGGQLAVSRYASLISIKSSETRVVTDFRPKMRRFLGWYA